MHSAARGMGGFTYLSLLLFVAITAAALAALGQRWSQAAERERDYAQAALALGAGRVRIMLRTILPNVAGPVLVGADPVDGTGAATGNTFVGQIDGVHVAAAPLYGNAFTPTRRPWPVASTRALWLFDDLKGPALADASGLGNTLNMQGSAALAKDACLGAPADAAVCGDGKVAAAFEACDDSNAASCDGCERCQARSTFEAAAKGSLATPALGAWAADASCPTCTATVEAWVKLDSTTSKQFLFASSCGSLVVYYASNAFYAVRAPEGPPAPTRLATGQTRAMFHRLKQAATARCSGFSFRLHEFGEMPKENRFARSPLTDCIST